MAEPNYAYNPAVASWVQSMSLAGIEEQELEQGPITQGPHAVDTPDSPSPDDYYKSAYTPAPEHDIAPPPIPVPPTDMSVTRQRQNTASSNNDRFPTRGGPRWHRRALRRRCRIRSRRWRRGSSARRAAT